MSSDNEISNLATKAVIRHWVTNLILLPTALIRHYLTRAHLTSIPLIAIEVHIIKKLIALFFGINQKVARLVLNKVSQQINRLELIYQVHYTPHVSDPRWPTSSRLSEKPFPQNLHGHRNQPLNQPHSHALTHASIDRPWLVCVPHKPATQFLTSSGGKPVHSLNTVCSEFIGHSRRSILVISPYLSRCTWI